MRNWAFLLISFLALSQLYRAADAFRGPVPRASIRPSIVKCNAVIEPGAALYDAAYAGNLDKMQEIIKAAKGDKKVLNFQSVERYGRTPLIISAYYNKVAAVKLLLATPGVDPNLGSEFGATALHFSAHRGHVEVVKALLADRRVKVNALATGGKWTGKSVLDVTGGMGMTGRPEIIELLRAKGAK